MTSDILYTILESEKFDRCQFALLLDRTDKSLNVYQMLVKTLVEKGLNIGYFIFDGTPYCGKVNRVAPIVNSLSVCVIDNTHIPFPEEEICIYDAIDDWLCAGIEPMRIGVFETMGHYPVVSKKLIERLGYMFHPICYGREAAECWLLSLGSKLEMVSMIEGCKLIKSPSKTIEFEGLSTQEDDSWAKAILTEVLDEEVSRLSKYLVK
jgi:hypothetical protein